MEARRKVTGRGGRERVSEQTEKGGREGERDRGREQEKGEAQEGGEERKCR